MGIDSMFHKDPVEGVTRSHLIGHRSETLPILLLVGEPVRIAGERTRSGLPRFFEEGEGASRDETTEEHAQDEEKSNERAASR
jgi:hypothetical protein